MGQTRLLLNYFKDQLVSIGPNKAGLSYLPLFFFFISAFYPTGKGDKGWTENKGGETEVREGRRQLLRGTPGGTPCPFPQIGQESVILRVLRAVTVG